MLLKLRPVCKDYLWGGTRLKTEFGLPTDLNPVAEGWMLSVHKDGENTVEAGKYKGLPLSQVLQAQGEKILGTKAASFDRFPLLIKLIDAKQNLSVQVHPDNDYALKNEGEYGKTECWYVLDCDEGAELIYGFQKPLSKAELEKRIKDNTFLEVVNRVKVHKGDFFFIEAGTLHAIGGGILLAEIQQNSNVTYRVYDYNRLGADGKPRPLHTEKAVAVTVCDKPQYDTKPLGEPEAFEGGQRQCLTRCPLFTVYAVTIETAYTQIADETSFVSLVCTDGGGKITCQGECFEMKKGDSFFLSANSGHFTLTGSATVIETRL